MDKAEAVKGIRIYAKTAQTGFLAFAKQLGEKMATGPHRVDSVMDLEKFIELRAIANLYEAHLSLDADGDSRYDDDKVLDRIEDARQSLTNWLLGLQTQQSGLFAVHQHLSREAAKRFLSETTLVDLIDPEPVDQDVKDALAWLRKGWDGDNSERAITAFETLDNAGIYKSIEAI